MVCILKGKHKKNRNTNSFSPGLRQVFIIVIADEVMLTKAESQPSEGRIKGRPCSKYIILCLPWLWLTWISLKLQYIERNTISFQLT